MSDRSTSRLSSTILRPLRDARWRRIGYAVLAAVLALLCFFPRPYVARAKLLPQDSSSAGLGQIVNSLGGQFSSFASLLNGGRPPNDLYLVIGRSATVSQDVIDALRLVGPDRTYATVENAKVALGKKVDVHLLLGGVLEIETWSRDPEQALAITRAFQKAISARIGELGRETNRRKSQIVTDRFRQAGVRVSETQLILDTFRERNRLASPEAQLGGQLSLRTNLQAQIMAKQVELQTLERNAGPENPELLNARQQLGGLRAQLAATDRPSLGAAGPNIAGLSALQSRYLNLYRDYRFAQALYEVYARASEQTAVESLVAESATYIQTVEPANLDAGRHVNVPAVASLIALVLIALFTELYVPATGLVWRDVTDQTDEYGRV